MVDGIPLWVGGPDEYRRYDPSSVIGGAGDDWLGVPAAAKLLGLQVHTVLALIDRGELPAEVTRITLRPRSRRTIQLRDAFLTP